MINPDFIKHKNFGMISRTPYVLIDKQICNSLKIDEKTIVSMYRFDFDNKIIITLVPNEKNEQFKKSLFYKENYIRISNMNTNKNLSYVNRTVVLFIDKRFKKNSPIDKGYPFTLILDDEIIKIEVKKNMIRKNSTGEEKIEEDSTGEEKIEEDNFEEI